MRPGTLKVKDREPRRKLTPRYRIGCGAGTPLGVSGEVRHN